jgi:hypothetical protein
MSEVSIYDALPFVCDKGHTKDVPTSKLTGSEIEMVLLGGVVKCNISQCGSDAKFDRHEFVRRLQNGQPNP